MKRRLVNLLAALSLLLCAAASYLWLRSYWVRDVITWHTRQQFVEVFSSAGALTLRWETSGSGWIGPTGTMWITEPTSAGYRVQPSYGRTIVYWPVGRFGVLVEDRQGDYLERELAIPPWLVCGIGGIAPLLWLRYSKPQPSELPVCPACGYDLRATPERCPECGTAVPAPQPAEANT